MPKIRLVIIVISCLLIGGFMLANREVPDRHVFSENASAGTSNSPVPSASPLTVKSGTVDQAVGSATPSPSPVTTTKHHRHHHDD